MKNINNNFLNNKTEPNQANYIKTSQKLADFHASCFTNSEKRYSEKSMLSFLEKSLYHIFYNRKSLAIIQVADKEAELITLAIKSKWRQKGNGYELLKSIIIYLANLGIKKIFLEVATTNKVALKLYQKVGFITCGLRKGYYDQGTDKKADAVIMSYTMVPLDNKKIEIR